RFWPVALLPGRLAPENLKFASKIIAISDAVAQNIKRADVDPSKIVRIYNGLDLSAFDPARYARAALRREAGLAPDSQVICMVARICEQKRQRALLNALLEMRHQCP